MADEIIARRFTGGGPIGVWPRSFEQRAVLLEPDCPWAASLGGEERLFPTFRAAVDYLYFECRSTRYEEPPTDGFRYSQD